jgi:Tfp pilus assembly protein PilN
MKVFNKRNALVGFLTLKWLEQRRKRRRSGMKRAALFVSLGLVSAGILAAVAGILYRRHADDQIEGYEVGDDSEYEIVGEVVTAGPEPIEPA